MTKIQVDGQNMWKTLIQMLVYIFVCGNKMMSTNEYSDYKEQMYDFFWKYDQDVGYETLKNKNLTNKQKNALAHYSNINDFDLTVDKIYKKMGDAQQSKPSLPREDFVLLNARHNIHWIREHAELIYKFNSIFFITSDIGGKGNIKLYDICKRLNYDDEDFQKFREYFFIDIRNSLSHGDYTCELDSKSEFKYVIYNTKNKTIKLDSNHMRLIIMKMIELNAIYAELKKYYKLNFSL